MRFSVYCMGPECFASGCGLYCAMMSYGGRCRNIFAKHTQKYRAGANPSLYRMWLLVIQTTALPLYQPEHPMQSYPPKPKTL